ncbi:DUF1345 domain-containing protein [Leifsonia sp. F6_8S_P_1B]|uniref:DUF1345 domain-containing protein n=1 Tax=Leifsonia williamsii TaxID=3035919 RepID=A0ABT8K8L7_9MICO|nr:DUF1345 domain-containing protein [Leifsonia williamsii]MDN4613806.1 DUF1345 domain-containing protein [Leifsonia williamsii]
MAGRLLSARRTLICVAIGIVTGTVAALVIDPRIGPLVGWCTAGIIDLVWVWRICWPKDSAGTERLAREESTTHITDDVIVAACLVSIAAVVASVVQSSNRSTDLASIALVILGMLGTIVAWALVNTVYAFKYARMYYVDHHGSGFDFNQESPPTYSDFAYLAFTIGMSYGVSEVEPNAVGTRRKALMHALLSYFFGTVLIAVAINIVTSLGGQG